MDNRIKRLHHESKIQEWSFHIQQCRQSGGNVQRYCREHHLTKSKYYYWQKIIFEKVSDEVQSSSVNSKNELALTSPKPFEEANEVAVVPRDLPTSEERPEFVELKTNTAPSRYANSLGATILVGNATVDIYNSIEPQLLQIIMKGLQQC